MRSQTPYMEKYETCSYAHAWLRIMADDLDSDEITKLLGVAPTQTQRKGEPWPGKEGRVFRKCGWYISTEGVLMSKDARHRFDWILGKVRGKRSKLAVLHSRGYLVDVCCRWDSKNGHGGLTLSPAQMHAFAELDLEVWFDVYVGNLDVQTDETQPSSGVDKNDQA